MYVRNVYIQTFTALEELQEKQPIGGETVKKEILLPVFHNTLKETTSHMTKDPVTPMKAAKCSKVSQEKGRNERILKPSDDTTNNVPQPRTMPYRAAKVNHAYVNLYAVPDNTPVYIQFNQPCKQEHTCDKTLQTGDTENTNNNNPERCSGDKEDNQRTVLMKNNIAKNCDINKETEKDSLESTQNFCGANECISDERKSCDEVNNNFEDRWNHLSVEPENMFSEEHHYRLRPWRQPRYAKQEYDENLEKCQHLYKTVQYKTKLSSSPTQ